MLKRVLLLLLGGLATACGSMIYQPTETISRVDPNTGYRLENAVAQSDDNLVILMFSGGGSRAAALGYGVLEQFKNTPVKPNGKGDRLIDRIDFVFGVSGGSVLAAYFSLHGREVIPKFEDNFLKKDFESEILSRFFSLSNLPKITAPQYGRGDLLQEQLNLSLYKGAKFGDLLNRRKGPFAVISATDMNSGQKITFTQDFFDELCLNLNDLDIARAVAASSAVPLVFSPLTLNNNGGNCHFDTNELIRRTQTTEEDTLRMQNVKEAEARLSLYQNSRRRPFLHLVDGGLTDNLGLSTLLDIYDLSGQDEIYQEVAKHRLKRIIVINVNAQNEVTSEIDRTADIPSTGDVINTIINVPIDRNTQMTLYRFREFADGWNAQMAKKPVRQRIEMHFVNLSLKDLPESELRKEVLNINTSFYLPHGQVNKLKQAAQVLLRNSEEYRRMLKTLQ